MNRYFKLVEDGYLISIGSDDFTGETIIKDEYNSLENIINNKPEDTRTHYYMLRADTLEYVAIERPEPLPEPEEPEPTYTLDEAAGIIVQEVAANE